jgi:hypothetical protein
LGDTSDAGRPGQRQARIEPTVGKIDAAAVASSAAGVCTTMFRAAPARPSA